MKVERVSETQVRFELCKADLDERNIGMNELSYGSDKTRQLFQEMITLAQDEYDFENENSPMMLEAMRVGAESIVVVVTRITEAQDPEQELIPEARTVAKFKRNPFIEPPEESSDEDSVSIFSFAALDILAEAVSRLKNNFTGESGVYKHQGRYFLALKNETPGIRTTDELEAVLYEYGEKHVSNLIARQYLVEHGEIIISDGAVEKLSLYFN